MPNMQSLGHRLFLLAIIFLALGSVNVARALSENPDKPPSEFSGEILSSTVQIRVYNQDCACSSLGLGTLFTINGEQFVLTHNHWSILSLDSIVAFYDWQNTFLREITGQEFLNLIYYQDAGNTILMAPGNLDIQALPLKFNHGLIKDDRLMVVLVDPKKPGQIKLTKARLLAYVEGESSGYAITTLSGELVVQGDSGAGVWHEDQLLGNTWSIILRNPPVKEWENYQVSFVARFPAGFEESLDGLRSITAGQGK